MASKNSVLLYRCGRPKISIMLMKKKVAKHELELAVHNGFIAPGEPYCELLVTIIRDLEEFSNIWIYTDNKMLVHCTI